MNVSCHTAIFPRVFRFAIHNFHCNQSVSMCHIVFILCQFSLLFEPFYLLTEKPIYFCNMFTYSAHTSKIYNKAKMQLLLAWHKETKNRKQEKTNILISTKITYRAKWFSVTVTKILYWVQLRLQWGTTFSFHIQFAKSMTTVFMYFKCHRLVTTKYSCKIWKQF
jgi:hypothetical protein